MEKRYYIHTYGCQMNVSDSQRMGEALAAQSYRPTPDAQSADLIIVNTCSIREKAEAKMLSALGLYRPVKLARGALIGVGGCVAQQEKQRIFEKAPFVDFVFGPDAIPQLGDIVRRVEEEGTRVVETAWMDSESYVFPQADPGTSAGKATELITVMKGCDNVCAFCVVPRTRGREMSRPFPEVLQEVAGLASVGVREVTLIGQNVNSYRGGCDFAELLLRIAQVPGIARIRFTTSHPHDLSDALVEAFRIEPKIAPHFHLPVQCGSDRILKLMRRDYTVERYLERLAALREARPGIAISTDIIVGYPGETDEEFEQTLALSEKVRYETQFSFVYSERPRTVAAIKGAEWGLVPHEVKIARLERLQKLQKGITKSILADQVGRDVEVLIEGPSRSNPEGASFGRTPENRGVTVTGSHPNGTLLKVRVERASHLTLFGSPSEASLDAGGTGLRHTTGDAAGEASGASRAVRA